MIFLKHKMNDSLSKIINSARKEQNIFKKDFIFFFCILQKSAIWGKLKIKVSN